jgi:hypothetical protein
MFEHHSCKESIQGKLWMKGKEVEIPEPLELQLRPKLETWLLSLMTYYVTTGNSSSVDTLLKGRERKKRREFEEESKTGIEGTKYKTTGGVMFM